MFFPYCTLYIIICYIIICFGINLICMYQFNLIFNILNKMNWNLKMLNEKIIK